MVLMVPYEAFACRCGAEDVVLPESYKSKTCGKLYYACPRSKPREDYFGCDLLGIKEFLQDMLLKNLVPLVKELSNVSYS
ncbi:hypothetical protein Tco_0279482 [Tanacetum coccineum]